MAAINFNTTCTLSGTSVAYDSGGAPQDRWTIAFPGLPQTIPTSVTCSTLPDQPLVPTVSFNTVCTLSGTPVAAQSIGAPQDRWSLTFPGVSQTIPTAINCQTTPSTAVYSNDFTDIISVLMIGFCFFAFLSGWSIGLKRQ